MQEKLENYKYRYHKSFIKANLLFEHVLLFYFFLWTLCNLSYNSISFLLLASQLCRIVSNLIELFSYQVSGLVKEK